MYIIYIYIHKLGWLRSQCIVDSFGTFDYMFGMNQRLPGISNLATSCRGTNTLIPLSKTTNVPIDTCFIKGQEQLLVDKIMKMTTGKVVVCWQHLNLATLASFLGVRNVPAFPDVFDVIWTIKGGTITVTKEPAACSFPVDGIIIYIIYIYMLIN